MFGSLKFRNQLLKYASIPSKPGTSTPYSSWYALQKNICQEVRFIALPSVPSPPVPCKFIPPGSKYIALHTILNNISWISAQSKAFSKSHNILLPESLLYMSINISLNTIWNVASVEVLILKPYCSLTSMLLVHICLYNLENILFEIVENNVKERLGY